MSSGVLHMAELSGCFSYGTEANVRELLSSGEPGVALEVLCSQLAEDKRGRIKGDRFIF